VRRAGTRARPAVPAARQPLWGGGSAAAGLVPGRRGLAWAAGPEPPLTAMGATRPSQFSSRAVSKLGFPPFQPAPWAVKPALTPAASTLLPPQRRSPAGVPSAPERGLLGRVGASPASHRRRGWAFGTPCALGCVLYVSQPRAGRDGGGGGAADPVATPVWSQPVPASSKGWVVAQPRHVPKPDCFAQKSHPKTSKHTEHPFPNTFTKTPMADRGWEMRSGGVHGEAGGRRPEGPRLRATHAGAATAQREQGVL